MAAKMRPAVAATEPLGLSRGAPIADGQTSRDAQRRRAVGDKSAPAQSAADNHLARGGGDESALAQTPVDIHPTRGQGYLSLRAIAEVYEDVQRVRIAVENRIAQGRKRELTIDGDLIATQLDGLHLSEKKLALLLARTYRANVPASIREWQKEMPGIGEHLLARLLGAIGDPSWAVIHAWEGAGKERQLIVVGERARRVSDLWSYCGHGDAKRKRVKGMTAEEAMSLGNPRAKMLVHLLAEACIKQVGTAESVSIATEGAPSQSIGSATGLADSIGVTRSHQSTDDAKDVPTPNLVARRRSPYRDVYDLARVQYVDRVDADGKEWTPAHQHAAALRLVGKEILRGLWLAAKETP